VISIRNFGVLSWIGTEGKDILKAVQRLSLLIPVDSRSLSLSVNYSLHLKIRTSMTPLPIILHLLSKFRILFRLLSS
jgi:hypothetical protein